VQLEEAKKKIDQGKRVLTNWRDLFRQTKQQIEDDGVDRWDFPCRAINERIPHMIDILRDLLDVADTLMKFLVFLGPNFKAVTENSAGIDSLVDEVK
jgi:dynein heavy chain